LAVAELRAFFAISFTSVAVAAGCYSPDALPQQPIFWDTVRWPTPVDTGHTVTRLLLFLLSLYKRWLSPMLGARCRFHPSCSDYARVAIARFGPARGGILGAWRILRCQPLCEGGLDPVPEHFVLRRCGAQGAHTHD
jgi:putative membrane protein insertion efficiency factor